MSNKFFLLILFFQCIFSNNGFPQTNHVWYFGSNAGVDFNSGSPTTLTNGAMNTNEGCASISDNNGNLLFYTDGNSVWTRNHTVMPNGSGLLGHASATSSAVIIPNPGNANRYYIFTVGSHDQHTGNPPPIPVCWSEIDMTLNNNEGDVIPGTKNTQLFTASTEKIAAVKHANGLYMWVICQELTGRYRSYLIDCSGINNPVTSDVGHSPLASGLGYLKVSSDGRRVANAMWANGFWLFDFNDNTGILSNPTQLGIMHTPAWAYGISFSINNNLLYGVNIYNGSITQWDLTAGSPAGIIASAQEVGIASGILSYRGGAIQAGPDGKLYITQYSQPWLSAILNPDIRGTGCNFQTNFIDLQSRNGMLGLPTFIASFRDTPGISYAGHCLGDTTIFSLNGTSAFHDSVIWNFGDPGAGIPQTGSGMSPDHRFSATGTFSVRAIRYLDCVSDTTYTTVTIKPLPVVDLGPDTTICEQPITLQSSVSYQHPAYLWNTGNISSAITISQTGSYWLMVSDSGCSNTDTIMVTDAKFIIDLGNDTSLCHTDLPFTLSVAHLPPGTKYLWSTGINLPQIQVTTKGKYWLHADINGCQGSDTIQVNIIMTPVIDIGKDSIICEQIPLQIGTVITGASYTWNTGATTPYINIDSSGRYILEVNLSGCRVRDTVMITAMSPADISIASPRDICPEQEIKLNASHEGNNRYIWNTGDTTGSISVTKEGTYSVTVITEYKCVSNDTTKLSYHPKPTVWLGADTTVCEETPLTIRAGNTNTDSLWWSNGSTDEILTVKYGGQYIVTGINKCGTVSDTIEVRQIFCEIWLPNAFTPNNDGYNDVFRILGNTEPLKDVSLSIYNRWGERVFATSDKTQGWDGYHKNAAAPIGTYVYLLRYNMNGKPYIQKGNFHLLR